MDIETRRRIRAYKKALPELRERVIAVALLLAMSASMLTSASFAWLTISRRPEVTGVSTTVAANGNLEIALATGTTTVPVKPNESAVGDSSSAQDVTKANITWGNLINLSDPSYGLDQLTLRPAQLNRSSLLINPLFGAEYTSDGRVEKLNSNFGFSIWQEQEGEWRFFVSDDIGVRAISSTTVEAVGFDKQVYEKRGDAESANLAAGSSYLAITQNEAWMNSLAAVMGTYMTAKMNAGQGDASLTNPTMQSKDVQNLTAIFGAFVGVYDQLYDAIAKLVNYQLFLLNNSESGSTPYTEITAEQLKTTYTTEALLKKVDSRIELSEIILNNKATDLLQTIKSDYDNLNDGYAKLQTLSGSVKWEDSGLNAIVNSLMDVGKCTVEGTPINNIGVSNAMGYLNRTNEAVLTNGVLYNFEAINGTRCEVKELSISAKVKRAGMTIPATVKANITTNAPIPSLFSVDLEYADSLKQGAAGVEVAQDTYGLALDLWVRTNAADSYLTLEGNVLTKSDWVQATGTDRNGNTVDIYTINRKVTSDEDGSEQTISMDLYQLETTAEDGTTTTTWYDATTHSVVELQETDSAPIKKQVEVITVIGYEGENRIWEDANAWEENSQLSLDSTTQGSGSCYVYYAESPEDMARSLELLDSMNVAFVDDKGTLMATAEMDTERFYAENGRVTVPLVLGTGSLNIGTDNDGNSIYAITPLEQNVPKRITAIVYLDGTELTNEHVLSASDIQGKLNIQFGSSELLAHAKDETLLNATRSVSASVSKNAFKYDESLETGTPMTTTVTVNVDGETPKTVTAFFIRAISSTQGSREETMTFSSADGGNTWTADYTFKAPGEYVLRSVDLDGQTYDLATPVPVTVEGFTIQSLTQSGGNHVSIMTASSSFSVDLALKFASSKQEAMPSVVQGRYLRQDGTAVNVNFTYNATTNTWNGKANFISSGDYTLQYLVLDGEYTELDESMWQSATVYLGMKTAIYTQSPSEFLYLPAQLTDNQKNLYMQVSIMDNTGDPMQGLQDAHLYYTMQGSSVNGMDAPLAWNGASGYYECTFPSRVGVYNFSHVTVGGNTITYAETAPSFRIISPNPPEYVAVGTDGGKTYFHENRDAYMTAIFDHSATSQVMALIRKDVKDSTGKVINTAKYYVVGQDPVNTGDRSEWKFYLPNAEAQDGYWTMETLYAWDYYTPAGQHVTTTLTKASDDSAWDYSTTKWIKESDLNEPAANIIHVDVTGENYWKKIIQKIEISFAAGQSQEFTGNAMLEPYEFSGLNVEFTDFQGQPVVDDKGENLVKNVKLTFSYRDGTSGTYGGYSSDNLLSGVTENTVITVNLKDDGSGTHFVQDGTAELLYAGAYTTTFSYQIGSSAAKTETSTDKTVRANMPVFTVSSNKPTVTVSSVSPTSGDWLLYSGTRGSDGEVPYNNNISGVFNTKTENSATVYIYTQDGERYNARFPEVTLKLSGVNVNDFTAEMTFVNQYSTDGNYDKTFEFAPDELEVTSEIGGAIQGSWGLFSRVTNPKIFPAGKQTLDSIEVVYNGMTFDVKLSNAVTINQPQYPPYVDFGDIFSADTSFDGTTPPMLYSTDGETVTLPSIPNTWTYQEGRPVNELVYGDYVEKETLGKYYVSTGWFSADHYHLNLYERTGSVVSDIYNITKKVQWSINGKIYNPGDTVEISGAVTATPVITKVSEQYVEQKTVTYTEESQMYVEVGKGYGYTEIDTAPEVNVRFNIKVTVN